MASRFLNVLTRSRASRSVFACLVETQVILRDGVDGPVEIVVGWGEHAAGRNDQRGQISTCDQRFGPAAVAMGIMLGGVRGRLMTLTRSGGNPAARSSTSERDMLPPWRLGRQCRPTQGCSRHRRAELPRSRVASAELRPVCPRTNSHARSFRDLAAARSARCCGAFDMPDLDQQAADVQVRVDSTTLPPRLPACLRSQRAALRQVDRRRLFGFGRKADSGYIRGSHISHRPL